MDECISLLPLPGGEALGTCRSVKVDPLCCTVEADCEDKNPCTQNTCVLASNSCTFSPVVLPEGTCCSPLAPGSFHEQCGATPCQIATCEGNMCKLGPAKTPAGMVCCSASDPAEVCDDGDASTWDVCGNQVCHHLPF